MNFFPSLRTKVMPLLGYWGLEQKSKMIISAY